VTVLVEEALGARVPAIVIDVKGDLPNLLLRFDRFDPETMGSWLTQADGTTSAEATAALLQARREALAEWSIGEAELGAYVRATQVRVITPGSSAALVLRLLGRDPDPARSREHVLLSVLAERRLTQGGGAPIAALMQDLANPPIENVGALPVNSFLKKSERTALAAAFPRLPSVQLAKL
jgi:hypothetical protein